MTNGPFHKKCPSGGKVLAEKTTTAGTKNAFNVDIPATSRSGRNSSRSTKHTTDQALVKLYSTAYLTGTEAKAQDSLSEA